MTWQPVTEFVDVMERTGRNGTRAHLPPDVVRFILAHPAWLEFLAERQRELVAQCQADAPPPPIPNSGATGSGIEPSATNGAFAGSMSPQLADAVARAEGVRALEVEAQAPRRRKR